MKNKKGFFTVALVLLFILLISYASITFLVSERKSQEVTIGKIQTDTINVYQDAEKSLFYIDQSAKYSAYKTAEELALKGGDFTNCGVEENYVLWQAGKKECYPTEESLKNSFTDMFNKNLNINLENYNKLNKNNLILDNYNLALEENNELKIIGNAKNNLEIKQENIDYSIKPNFITKIDYNFTDYLEISKKVKNTINKCNQDLTCWKTEHSDWTIDQNGNLFMFNVLLTRKTLFSEKNIIIKFGINFNPLL